MVAKAADIAQQTDILLGNLEDAIPVDRKEAARAGLIKAAKESDFGQTSLWTRVNSLENPWALDDLTTLVGRPRRPHDRRQRCRTCDLKAVQSDNRAAELLAAKNPELAEACGM